MNNKYLVFLLLVFSYLVNAQSTDNNVIGGLWKPLVTLSVNFENNDDSCIVIKKYLNKNIPRHYFADYKGFKKRLVLKNNGKGFWSYNHHIFPDGERRLLSKPRKINFDWLINGNKLIKYNHEDMNGIKVKNNTVKDSIISVTPNILILFDNHYFDVFGRENIGLSTSEELRDEYFILPYVNRILLSKGRNCIIR